MPGGTVCPGHGDALATTCCFDEDQSQPVRAPGLMNGPGTGIWELRELDEKNACDKRRRTKFDTAARKPIIPTYGKWLTVAAT
jgi:hypothetical protein